MTLFKSSAILFSLKNGQKYKVNHKIRCSFCHKLKEKVFRSKINKSFICIDCIKTIQDMEK
ncbi:MAG: hypothetical protein SVO01_00670 [Thermotogota bacterium]|nr:hypothetical protein [Thermotogota bacterium]